MANILVVQNQGAAAGGVWGALLTPRQLADCLNHVAGAVMQIDFDLLSQMLPGDSPINMTASAVGTTVIEAGLVVITPTQFTVA